MSRGANALDAAVVPPSRNVTATHSFRRGGPGRGRGEVPDVPSWERYVQVRERVHVYLRSSKDHTRSVGVRMYPACDLLSIMQAWC